MSEALNSIKNKWDLTNPIKLLAGAAVVTATLSGAGNAFEIAKDAYVDNTTGDLNLHQPAETDQGLSFQQTEVFGFSVLLAGISETKTHIVYPETGIECKQSNKKSHILGFSWNDVAPPTCTSLSADLDLSSESNRRSIENYGVNWEAHNPDSVKPFNIHDTETGINYPVSRNDLVLK